MRHPESDLQIAAVRWFRYQYPKAILFAIPNGGKRNAREAARMKAEGTTPGVPDLFIAEPRGIDAGLFIEMKAGKGKVSAEQKDMGERLLVAGYGVAVCRSFEEFKATVTTYLSRPSLHDNDPVQLLST